MDHRFPERRSAILADGLQDRAEANPDKLFALFEDDTWTYRPTADRAWAAANGLLAARETSNMSQQRFTLRPATSSASPGSAPRSRP
jgi:hypothetical protein